MDLPKGLKGLQDWFFGKPFNRAVYTAPATGLNILAADGRNIDNALDLLVRAQANGCIRRISKEYDHVIIDTPPVLAFSDALVWAKMADAVILTSLANTTSSPDLRDSVDRLKQIGVHILGTVLQNVKAGHGYYRYGYGYGYEAGHDKKRRPARQAKKQKLLLATDTKNDKST